MTDGAAQDDAAPEQPFAAYQYEIYGRGLAGERPALPTDVTALEAVARERLTPEAWGYVAGGAHSGATVRANRAAFDRWRLLPRMLRDVSTRDLSCQVLGTPMPAPVLLGPVGVQSIVHDEGECATARAAQQLGLPMVLSTASSRPLEEVAEANGDGPRWYQLYWPKDRDVAASFLDRAERAAYSVLVVTLDTSLLAWRPYDLDQAYLPFLQAVGIANYLTDPAFQAGLDKPVDDDQGAAIGHFIGMFADPSKTWDDLAFVREHWRGPIALKGVLHPDDARRAVDAGIEGVIVSNHGGRQVDGAVATLDALPAVVEAVGDRAEVLFDSGIRTGADVVKALALGAKAVLVGRPYIYGLGLGGAEGVVHVLRSLLADLDLTLALTGHRSLAEVGRESIVAV